MVYGIVGDDAGGAEWAQITDDFLGSKPSPSRFAWQSEYDAIVDLHRGDSAGSLSRLTVDIDDPVTWWHASQTKYRPWTAAVWPRRPCWPDETTQATASSGPAGRRGRTRSPPRWWNAPPQSQRSATFAALGRPYQQERTRVLAESRSW
jgi:hypothetical protein